MGGGVGWGESGLGLEDSKVMEKLHTDLFLSCGHSGSLHLFFSDVMYSGQANPQRTLHLRELSYRYAKVSA